MSRHVHTWLAVWNKWQIIGWVCSCGATRQ